MAPQLEDRIATLKAKKQALATRLAQLETRAKTEERKRDTRRNILVGAAIIAAMESDPFFAGRVRAILAQAVTRESDIETISDLLPSTSESAAASEAATMITASTPLSSSLGEVSGG